MGIQGPLQRFTRGMRAIRADQMNNQVDAVEALRKLKPGPGIRATLNQGGLAIAAGGRGPLRVSELQIEMVELVDYTSDQHDFLDSIGQVVRARRLHDEILPIMHPRLRLPDLYLVVLIDDERWLPFPFVGMC